MNTIRVLCVFLSIVSAGCVSIPQEIANPTLPPTNNLNISSCYFAAFSGRESDLKMVQTIDLPGPILEQGDLFVAAFSSAMSKQGFKVSNVNSPGNCFEAVGEEKVIWVGIKIMVRPIDKEMAVGSAVFLSVPNQGVGVLLAHRDISGPFGKGVQAAVDYAVSLAVEKIRAAQERHKERLAAAS